MKNFVVLISVMLTVIVLSAEGGSIMPVQRWGMKPPAGAYEQWDRDDANPTEGQGNHQEHLASEGERESSGADDDQLISVTEAPQDKEEKINMCKEMIENGDIEIVKDGVRPGGDENEVEESETEDEESENEQSEIKIDAHQIAALKFSCNFENGWCGIEEDCMDDFDWTRTNESTPSEETGPEHAYSGDHYIHIEASERQHLDKARFLLPVLARPYGKCCLQFKFHMYGHHTGALKSFIWRNHTELMFEANDIGRWEYFSQQGDQGNHWNHAQISLYLQQEDRIAFEAISGEDYLGDIAVDDIIVLSGHCTGGSSVLPIRDP